MIFDLIFGLIAVGALFNGYKNGLITTILRTAFFIAGGVALLIAFVGFRFTVGLKNLLYS